MATPAERVRSLVDEIRGVAVASGDAGVAMGELVDAVVARGFAVEAIEAAIWALLGARLLTPSGFVCRLVRGPEGAAASPPRRTYELRLAAWSPERDGAPDDPADAAEGSG